MQAFPLGPDAVWKIYVNLSLLCFKKMHYLYSCIYYFAHSQRKQARELLAALQKVVVPIYCTSFLAVEEDKQQKIARVSISVPKL